MPGEKNVRYVYQWQAKKCDDLLFTFGLSI
jgi:hypothetical protein